MSFHAASAASSLVSSWLTGQPVAGLATDCQPENRAQGYEVQSRWSERVGPVGGWKIAATSVAGQRHIGVSGPLVGPVFAHRIAQDGATVSLALNRMRVAECEIVFRFGRALEPRTQGWLLPDILNAVVGVHPGIEVPDSRFLIFETAGEAQLIADCACSNDMVIGTGLSPDARLQSLASLKVQAHMSDDRRFEGAGSNVMGDPLEALRWFVNEITQAGHTLQSGQFVTTGACVVPIPIVPGQTIHADFGWLGRMVVHFS